MTDAHYQDIEHTLKRIIGYAVSHPDDDEADIRRNARHIEALARAALARHHAAKEAEPDLAAALKWAMPLVETALEDCRQMRLQHGHDDIKAMRPNGTVALGLSQREQDNLDHARAALDKVTGAKP